MKSLAFILAFSLSVCITSETSAQSRKNNEKDKKTDSRIGGRDTSKLDTTNLGTKTGTGTIGSGTTMTDTTSVTPPDKTKTKNNPDSQVKPSGDNNGEDTKKSGKDNQTGLVWVLVERRPASKNMSDKLKVFVLTSYNVVAANDYLFL